MLRTLRLIILPFATFPFLSRASILPSYSYEDDFDLISIPILKKENNQINIRLSFKSTLKIKRSLVVTAYYPNNDYQQDVATVGTTNRFINTIFSYTPSYLEEKVKFTLDAKSSDGTTMFEKTFDVSMATYAKIWPNSQGSEYTANDKGYYYKKGSSEVRYNEAFSFTNFNDYYELDSVLKIDFSKFRIKYSTTFSNKSLTYKNITFFIENIHEVFNSFGTLSIDSKMTNIELSLNYDSDQNDYYLGFKNREYVNPSTLLMSDTYEQGMVETSFLYLPKEYSTEFKSILIGFVVYELGLNMLQVAAPFSLLTSKSALGNCANSDYCISVNSANPDFEIGTVVNHG